MYSGPRQHLVGRIWLSEFSPSFSPIKSSPADFIAPCVFGSVVDRINWVVKGAKDSEGPVCQGNYQEDVSPLTGGWHIMINRIGGKGHWVRECFESSTCH